MLYVLHFLLFLTSNKFFEIWNFALLAFTGIHITAQVLGTRITQFGKHSIHGNQLNTNEDDGDGDSNSDDDVDDDDDDGGRNDDDLFAVGNKGVLVGLVKGSW